MSDLVVYYFVSYARQKESEMGIEMGLELLAVVLGIAAPFIGMYLFFLQAPRPRR